MFPSTAGLAVVGTQSCGKEEKVNSPEKAPEHNKGSHSDLSRAITVDGFIETSQSNVFIRSFPGEAGSLVQELGYLNASQRFELQTTVRQVFSRCYSTKYEPYIVERQSISHQHIQQVYVVASGDNSETFEVSFEKADRSLASFIKTAKHRLPKAKWDALLRRFTSQSVDAVGHLHSKSMYHGRLNGSICIKFNLNFKQEDIEYYDVTVILPEYKELQQRNYSLKCPVNAPYASDWRALADVVGLLRRELFGISGIKASEYLILESFLRRTSNVSSKALGRQLPMLAINIRIELIKQAAGRMAGRFEAFEKLDWRNHFQKQIIAMDAISSERNASNAANSAPSRRHNTLDSYIWFQRSTFQHYHEWKPSVQILFGCDLAVVHLNFQKFYEDIYCDIYKRAVLSGWLENFFAANDM